MKIKITIQPNSISDPTLLCRVDAQFMPDQYYLDGGELFIYNSCFDYGAVKDDNQAIAKMIETSINACEQKLARQLAILKDHRQWLLKELV